MDTTRSPQDRPCVPTRDRDVDRERDRIDEAMPRKRCLQTERGARDPFCDLDEVGVRGGGVPPSIHAAAERGNLAAVAKSVKPRVADSRSLRVSIGKGVTEN